MISHVGQNTVEGGIESNIPLKKNNNHMYHVCID